MARSLKPYGRWSQQMLARLRARELLKVEAFVAWLKERGIQVDRTLISHWVAGRTHLPADMLVWLARFTGRADLVFGEHLTALGWVPMRLPEEGATNDADLVDLMLGVGSSLGGLLRAALDARAPDSPGGREITTEERAAIADRLDGLIHQLVDLRARLTAGSPLPHSEVHGAPLQ